MAKETKMRKLQQQMTILRTQQQQQQREEKVEELQAEAKRVTRIIQPIHQKVCEVAASVEKFMPEHVIFELVEQM